MTAKRGRPRTFPLSPFGERLRAAIRHSPFQTREAFRRAANIPISSLYRYEMGQSPRAELIEKWALLLGVPATDLLDCDPTRVADRWENAVRDSNALTLFRVVDVEARAMESLAQLSDEARERVLTWAIARWRS